MDLKIVSNDDFLALMAKIGEQERELDWEEWDYKTKQIEKTLEKWGKQWCLADPEGADYGIGDEFQDAPYIAMGFCNSNFLSRPIINSLMETLRKSPEGFSISIECDFSEENCPYTFEILLTDKEGAICFFPEVELPFNPSSEHENSNWVKQIKQLLSEK